MTKAAAMQAFWESFGLPAYEESSVPPDASFPRITYQFVSDSIGSPVFFSVSVWYKSTSWVQANAKKDEISKRIGIGGKRLQYDGGFCWLLRGRPFDQSSGDPENPNIKRKILNIAAEYMSAD